MKKICVLFILLLFFSIFTGFITKKSQEIAIVVSNDLSAYQNAVSGFLEDNMLPYNIYSLTGQTTVWSNEIYPQILTKKPDIIFSVGALAAQLTSREFPAIPNVFCLVKNPSQYGLDVAKNTTGISLTIPLVTQIQTIKEIFPAAKKIGIIYNPKNTHKIVMEINEYCKRSGIAIVPMRVDSKEAIPRALRSLRDVNLIWLLRDSSVLHPKSLQLISSFSKEMAIPVVGFSRETVEDGALLALEISYRDMGKQAYELLQSILTEKSGQEKISIFAPKKLELVYNMSLLDSLNNQELVNNIKNYAQNANYRLIQIGR